MADSELLFDAVTALFIALKVRIIFNFQSYNSEWLQLVMTDLLVILDSH